MVKKFRYLLSTLSLQCEEDSKTIFSNQSPQRMVFINLTCKQNKQFVPLPFQLLPATISRRTLQLP